MNRGWLKNLRYRLKLEKAIMRAVKEAASTRKVVVASVCNRKGKHYMDLLVDVMADRVVVAVLNPERNRDWTPIVMHELVAQQSPVGKFLTKHRGLYCVG